MRCITLFLVLSMVVLMAEPGDAFIHHIFDGIAHVGNTIHGMIKSWGQKREQQDQKLYDRLRVVD